MVLRREVSLNRGEMVKETMGQMGNGEGLRISGRPYSLGGEGLGQISR